MTDPSDPDPETLARLERAVRRMPRLRREIFLAVRLDDASYDYIAACTGLSVRQIERQLAKAIRTLDLERRGEPLGWWRSWFG